MIQTITTTELLRNPERIRKKIKQGFTIKVMYNGENVFDIIKPVKIVSKKIKSLPKLSGLSLPDKMTKRELYEKYGY